jgi:FkbM family methyltransferase
MKHATRIIQALMTLLRLFVLDKKSIAIVLWRLRRGESTLRIDYDLGPDSVVFDVGGYRGDFAQKITSRFDSRVHVFEPLHEYCEEIRRKLAGNPKVVVNEFGLSDRTTTALISVDEASSSVMAGGGDFAQIRLVDIQQYVSQLDASRIDLIKINIEGAEYGLLRRMHEAGLIPRCRDIQIQFHDFVPDAIAQRERLRGILAVTHELTYDYYFIWENWRLRDGA